MNKGYIYRVYNASGTFVGLWNDVVSEFAPNEEINNAGSEVRVILARAGDDFGEGVDIDFEFTVKIYAVDGDDENGLLVYTGKIVNYTPMMGGKNERVEVILFGGGGDLADYMVDYGDSIINENADGFFNYASSGFNYYVLAQTFTITEKTRIWSIDLLLQSTDFSQVTVRICTGTPSTYNTLSGVAGAFKTQIVTSQSFEENRFAFTDGVELEPGTYSVVVEIPDHGASLNNQIKVENTIDWYTGGALYHCADSVTDPGQSFVLTYPGTTGGAYDLWFRINAGPQQPFFSMDPSEILQKILDFYQDQGGIIGYDVSSIDLTGTVVSYRFNSNTVLEAVQKILELCPVDWYWYVDQTTNLLHLHQKTTSIQHSFIFGKHFTEVSPEKRSEDIVNTVYFTGGGTPPLFKKYTRDDSIALYGRRIKKYVDERVTDPLTAATIAKRILDQRNAPEIRLSFEVLDNAVDANRGYDLESIKVGDSVAIRNVGNGGTSLWDVAFWDEDYWDYNVKDLGTVVLQIVRIERNTDSAKIYCSTVPPDVSKRIEDINRNLEAAQTANNETLSVG